MCYAVSDIDAVFDFSVVIYFKVLWSINLLASVFSAVNMLFFSAAADFYVETYSPTIVISLFSHVSSSLLSLISPFLMCSLF